MQGAHSRIVSEEHDTLLNLIRKGFKCVAVVLHVLIIIDMIQLDIGNDGIFRLICQKMTLILTGFQHKITAVLRHFAGSITNQITGWRRQTHYVGKHAGRCRFAMCTRYGYRCVFLRKTAEELMIPVGFHSIHSQGFFHLRIGFIKSISDNHGISLMNIICGK